MIVLIHRTSRLTRYANRGVQTIAAALFLATATIQPASAIPALPESAPLPAQRPASNSEAATGTANKLRPERAEEPDSGRDDISPATPELPRVSVPVPEPRPGPTTRRTALRQPRNPNADDLPACHNRLNSLGVGFEPQAPIAEENGCAIAAPVLVDRLAPDIELLPPALLDCPAAEIAAHFARDVADPAAKEQFGARIVAIRQASGYVCRQRNGEEKLSEHAFGNALDVSGFELANGRSIRVAASGNRAVRDFLRAVRGEACGPFKTVLGPGSNADHATHFHFDLAERRNGATYCR